MKKFDEFIDKVKFNSILYFFDHFILCEGEELRRHNQDSTSVSSLGDIPQQSHVQYEVVDEDGNPMAINDVQDLIKMSGVRAREVPQADGTIIKEYVIDDPQVLSQFRSQQQQQQSPMTSSYIQQQPPMTLSYNQQRHVDQNAPPPPPRVPLRAPLFRQGNLSMNDNLPHNIQQIHVLEPQRRYEYLTTTGQRIQFHITNSNNFNGQLITDPDIRELTNAINTRLLPTSTSTTQQPLTQTQFNQPKQWHQSVDLMQRQRLGSDSQPYSSNSNIGFQQIQTDLPRSTSNGTLNQGSYPTQYQLQQQVFNEPVNNWNKYQYQDSHHQTTEPFQTSAQFLPQQQMPTSSPMNNNHSSISYAQSPNYPYQGQQQHGVRILNDYNQQQSVITTDGHTRI
jgi:hypothetical protein